MIAILYSFSATPWGVNVTLTENFDVPELCNHYTIAFKPVEWALLLRTEQSILTIALPDKKSFGLHRIYYCWGRREVQIDGHIESIHLTPRTPD